MAGLGFFSSGRVPALLSDEHHQNQSCTFRRHRIHFRQSWCSGRKHTGRNSRNHGQGRKRTSGNPTNRKFQQSCRIRHGVRKRCLARYVHHQAETLGRTSGQRKQRRRHIWGDLPTNGTYQERQHIRILPTYDFRLRHRKQFWALSAGPQWKRYRRIE